MNPIEHLWDYVSRGAIHNRLNQARTAEELSVAAEEEWNNILQEIINNLIISVPRLVQILMKSRGHRLLDDENLFSLF